MSETAIKRPATEDSLEIRGTNIRMRGTRQLSIWTFTGEDGRPVPFQAAASFREIVQEYPNTSSVALDALHDSAVQLPDANELSPRIYRFRVSS